MNKTTAPPAERPMPKIGKWRAAAALRDGWQILLVNKYKETGDPHFHKPKPRPSRHGVITPDGTPAAPRQPRGMHGAFDETYFRSLADAPIAQTPRVSPAALPDPVERRAALTMRTPSRPPGPPRTAHGIRIVPSFFADPAFAQPLREFVRTVHHRAAEMAAAFDANAARIEAEHQLDTHFAASRRDAQALAARYHEGGTATMADLVEQVRGRIVADALTGGAR